MTLTTPINPSFQGGPNVGSTITPVAVVAVDEFAMVGEHRCIAADTHQPND